MCIRDSFLSDSNILLASINGQALLSKKASITKEESIYIKFILIYIEKLLYQMVVLYHTYVMVRNEN